MSNEIWETADVKTCPHRYVFAKECPDCKGWISVKDRLPPNGNVLATFIHEGRTRVETINFDNGCFTFQNIPINLLVTHWMLFPEPPDGINENN